MIYSTFLTWFIGVSTYLRLRVNTNQVNKPNNHPPVPLNTKNRRPSTYFADFTARAYDKNIDSSRLIIPIQR